jgi:cell wall-associated NlpC family hydrolase
MSVDAGTFAGAPPSLTEALGRIAAIQQMTASVAAPTVSSSFEQAMSDVSGGGATATSTTASTATGGVASTGTATGADVVANAQQYLGVPYKWGGTDPATGLDCSGLVQKVFSNLGVTLPRTTYDQVNQGTAVPDMSQAKPGDLLFYGSPPEHVGIYVGDGKMLDAPHTGAVVRVEAVWGTPSTIRRILPSDDSSATTAATTATASSGAQTASDATSSSAFAADFAASASKYGVSSQLLSALAQVESSDNPNAVSPAGAQGLMQLMPSTAASLGVNALDPAQAIDGAAKLLSGYLKEFGGSTDEAVAAYNAGPNAVKAYGGIPPYAETEGEVRKVDAILGEVHG